MSKKFKEIEDAILYVLDQIGELFDYVTRLQCNMFMGYNYDDDLSSLIEIVESGNGEYEVKRIS